MIAGAEPRRRTISPRAALVALMVGGLLFSATYPASRYLDLRASTEALRQEERALDATIADLKATHDTLSTDEEVERLARAELGMVRPGEVPYVVVQPREKQPAPPPVTADTFESEGPAAAKGSWLSRWAAMMRGAFGPLR